MDSLCSGSVDLESVFLIWSRADSCDFWGVQFFADFVLSALFPVSGLFRMFPAGPSPKEAISYSKKNGTLAAMLEWIGESSSHRVDVDISKVPEENAADAPMPMMLISKEKFDQREAEAMQRKAREGMDEERAREMAAEEDPKEVEGVKEEEDVEDSFFTEL